MRKHPIKHRVKAHVRKTNNTKTVVHQHIRGRSEHMRKTDIANPTVRTAQSLRTLRNNVQDALAQSEFKDARRVVINREGTVEVDGGCIYGISGISRSQLISASEFAQLIHQILKRKGFNVSIVSSGDMTAPSGYGGVYPRKWMYVKLRMQY